MSSKKVTVKVWAYTCERCGHNWQRIEETAPIRCANPACRSPYWSTPKGKLAKGRPPKTS